MSALQWGEESGAMQRDYSSSRRRPSSRDSPQHSRRRSASYRDFDDVGDVTLRQTDNAADDDDRLAPLSSDAAPMRRNRQRVESFSSIGSSVAPAALPQHRVNRRNVSGNANALGPAVNLPYESRYSNLSEWQQPAQEKGRGRSDTNTSMGEGGLEAWLRSQAVAVPSSSSNAAKMDSQRRYGPRLDASDALSDGGRSNGVRSVDNQRNGRGSKRSIESKHRTRAGLPDWQRESSGGADDDGLNVRRRTTSKVSGGLRDLLSGSAIDVEHHIPIERSANQQRRELSAATMSASGVRLREGVRRLNRSGTEDQHASLNAMISSAAPPRSGTISASSSMGMHGASHSLHAAAAVESGNQQRTANVLGKSKVHLGQTFTKDENVQATPLRMWAKAMLMEQSSSTRYSTSSPRDKAKMAKSLMGVTIASAVLISIFAKWTTSLGGWSGRGKAPMYGDFEAQRHWIELTLHLPPSQWYFYDLPYWGLDYPPLTAHVSRWCGLVAQKFFPNVARHFALDVSRGSESVELDIFMHASVLACDLLIYTPTVLLFLGRKLQGRGRRTRAMAILTVLLQPSLILVDYGHFQYNNVMLGFAAGAFAFLYTSLPNPESSKASSSSNGKGATNDMRDRMKTLSRRVSFEYIAAAVLFSLSLCFKQMALYYAPAVFAVMLGRCIGLARIGFERGLICFFGIALATTLTFAFSFRLWLGSVEQLAQIVHRIFPMARGLFEDKVSNVWCFLSVAPLPSQYKIKNLLSVQALARMSLGITLLAILLPCVHLFAAAAETVHIEMYLDEESKRQVQASEKRKAEGSVVGGSSVSGRRSRYMSLQAAPAPSEVGSELASLAGGGLTTARNSTSLASQRVAAAAQVKVVASSSPSPAASLLPYAMLSTSMAFYLFGFQTHEKSILLPLLPMTLLMSVKGDEWGGGAGKTDWEWAVLMNNAATFSMWPLFKRDGVQLQYVILTLAWNWTIGNRPFADIASARKSFVGLLSAVVHATIIILHAIELALPAFPTLAKPMLARYPDLFAVLNVLACTPIFCLVWLWATKRQLEVGFANGIDIVGLQGPSRNKLSTQSKRPGGVDRGQAGPADGKFK